MANPLNIYTGPESLKKYYDPDHQPLLPLVEIPEKLNPFVQDNVRIYAKMMSCLPANNIKSLPSLNMLQSDSIDEDTKTIVEYSSGSTAVSMSIIARVLHNISDTRAFLSNKTSEAKLRMMRFFGLSITLFGGPSQPEPTDPRGGIQRAQQMAEEGSEVVNPNQYTNQALLKQLPNMSVFCAGMGTAGTMTGIGQYLKQNKDSIVRVGVCTVPGDRVPGPRAYALLAPIDFHWKEAVDSIEEVGSSDSYRLSMLLSREGLICGPSSGFNLQGLYNFLQKRHDQGTLDDLADHDGKIHCVFLCCDLPYQYLDEYFSKLEPESFPPMKNSNLLNVDLYRYDEKWEIEAADALSQLYGSATALYASPALLNSEAMILDLRSTSDYSRSHLPGAINLPLRTLSEASIGAFEDADVLEAQWLELEAVFTSNQPHGSALSIPSLKQYIVTLICYDGDTSRIGTSILRAKGVSAFSVRHGVRGGGLGRASSVEKPAEETDRILLPTAIAA
ncbi:hypothetical protein MMC29_000226 [Sticta canariensis]|nr:hypothetical protein [Sticta canariensis]